MTIDRPLMWLGFSTFLTGVAIVSLLVGKTPYLGLGWSIERNFIARRKWDPVHFWVGVSQYVFAAIFMIFMALGH